MAQPIVFHFDFSSTYGYIASTKIDALAARFGREVQWKPFLLGATFKVTGLPSLPSVPLKGDYSARDVLRSARFHAVPFRMPTVFPISTQAPARAFYWLTDRDPAAARQLAAALYRAYFVDDVNISNPSDTARVAASLGHDEAAVLAALEDPAIKLRLKTETEMAIARGVFGSPFIFVDDEPFWGVDRLDQVARWLETGGF
ncbi:MAG: 2-hydroxychromene-2-carboxylate isomerase [Betaproteobacteria bacterium]|nr:2-hydroxychromene-2-carboxylate isomerase [Betaproteobacteria bacterium]